MFISSSPRRVLRKAIIPMVRAEDVKLFYMRYCDSIWTGRDQKGEGRERKKRETGKEGKGKEGKEGTRGGEGTRGEEETQSTRDGWSCQVWRKGWYLSARARARTQYSKSTTRSVILTR
jgi:hypothetical protein